MSDSQAVQQFTSRDVVSVALRIIGFVWLIRVANSVIVILNTISAARYWMSDKVMHPAYEIRVILPHAIELCIAFLLIFLGEQIAGLVIRFSRTIPRADEQEWSVAWFEACAAVFGFAIFTLGVLYGSVALMRALSLGELPSKSVETHWLILPNWSEVVVWAAWVILGAFCAVFAQSLSRVLHGTATAREADE